MKNDLLKKSLDSLGIKYDEDQIEKFDLFYDLLTDWNKRMNLTAITEYDDVVIKHFVDSILICKFEDLKDKKIIDIGTGAGFPGIPLKIINPSCEILLLDSLNKRIVFLEEVVRELGLKNVRLIHGRAEDLAHKEDFREVFDYAVSRAVSNLSTLSEYCIPFIKTGGFFISYKSEGSDEEIEKARNAIKILGSKIRDIKEYPLPYSDIKRKFVVIEKLEKVKNKYPRKAGVPVKDPL
ncbi:MAG: 16S rRNA (guanine(527)-N(7))-methyltransferase RsmG [Lachnospiraceae bacterium]|nr:16S rRNA (guanine(527)-N(7))-methyltransferase RsmG [Lachnospiraceae bacterium]